MIEGREEFVRDNAMALLKQRDEKIERMRKIIDRLHQSVRSLRAELKRTRNS